MSKQPVILSRRFMFAAAALVLGVSACGDPSTQSSAGPVKIELSAAPGAPSASGSADRSMMLPGLVTYVYSGEFPELAASGPSWFFAPGVSPNLDRLQAMARVMGVDGAPAEMPGDPASGWMVGSVDGTASSLWVGADATQSWWYNPDPSVWQGSGMACETVSSDGTTDLVLPDPCPEPTPPQGVLSKDEALDKAMSLATDLGYDAGSYSWEAFADDWSANVNGVLLLDGVRSNITLSVGFGENGVVTWASGSMATPQRGGDYPLVGPQGGLDRMNEQGGMWFGTGVDPAILSSRSYTTTADNSVGTATSSEAVVPVPPEAPTSVVPLPAVEPPLECGAAVDCLPQEPITVTFTSVRVDTTTVWATDGTVWVLPAYTFGSDDGGSFTVLGVDDSFVDIGAPLEPEPVPAPEPAPAPLPEPTPLPEPSGTGVVTPATVVAPDDAVAGELLVGLSEDDAAKVAAARGWTLRVTERDGEFLAVTEDFSLTRVNVVVESGFVVKVARIG